jgi:hypothetical protein
MIRDVNGAMVYCDRSRAYLEAAPLFNTGSSDLRCR